MENAAVAFTAARDRALAAQLAPGIAKQVNTTLLGVERQLTRPQGLVTRPWFRNLIYASDENNGYSTMTLPSVNGIASEELKCRVLDCSSQARTLRSRRVQK
jgi:N-acetylated-alpha-linked acidic dipeptidase